MRTRVVGEHRLSHRLGRAPVGLRRLFSGGAGLPAGPDPLSESAEDQEAVDDELVASLMPDDGQNPIVRGLMNVLPLAGPEAPHRSPPIETYAPASGEARDWTATLGLVERAVAAVRASEERALDLEVRSRESSESFEEERRVTRARIISAESRAEEAEFRAGEAEAYAREVEIRLDELERELEDARVLARQAEARAIEAETWLKRLHDALMDQAFARENDGSHQA